MIKFQTVVNLQKTVLLKLALPQPMLLKALRQYLKEQFQQENLKQALFA